MPLVETEHSSSCNRGMRILFGSAIVCLLFGSVSTGQIPRYELGKRVKRFEREFERAIADESARAKVLPNLQAAVAAFFTLNASKACSQIDKATLALSHKPASELSLLAMTFEPHRRVLDPAATELTVRIRPLYGSAPVENQNVTVELVGSDGQRIATQSTTTGAKNVVLRFESLTEGEYTLTTRIDGSPLSKVSQGISVIKDFQSRLQRIQAAAKSKGAGPNEPFGFCVREWGRQLDSLGKGKKPETDVPAHRLLTRLEAWLADGESKLRPSVSRMVLFTGRRSVTCRVRLSRAAFSGNKRPVVIALHGAGGSESMFYETYGAGKIVDLCRQRDWVLVCPRISSLFGLSMTAEQMLASLESQGVAVDRSNVFVVGHSMGVGTAMKFARQDMRLAAVAALGGGSSSVVSEENRKTPFLVAAGDRDFGRNGAISLARGLRKRGVDARYETYKNTEHLGIVQIALDDVFRFFSDQVR